MRPVSQSNLLLGLCCVAFAAIAIFVWIPLDTETGIVEQVRRRIQIGDALAPTVAAVFVGLGGLLLVIFERRAPDQPQVQSTDLLFVFVQTGILIAGFVIMLVAGPIALAFFDGDAEYRLLRDTAPWKYIGFLLGGTFIVAGLVSQAEGRFRGRNILIGVAVTCALIAVYDLPFDDLLLPPNGDY